MRLDWSAVKGRVIKHYSEIFDEYGINVLEDNCSSILICFCPWCGKKLPLSKRDKWFKELEEKGFENPLFADNIPESYKSGSWRNKQNFKMR